MKNFSITFYIKKDKVNDSGEAAIYAKVKANGTEVTFSTRKMVTPSRWKDTNHLNKTRDDGEKAMRTELGVIESGFKQLFDGYDVQGMHVTAEVLKNNYFNPVKVEKPKTHTLLELYELHNSKFLERVKAGMRSAESHTKYKSVHLHVIDFMKDVYGVNDFDLDKLNYEFIERFDLYMRLNKKCGNNTTVKYIQFLRAVINSGIKYEWLNKDPFGRYEGKLQEVETHFLTEEQLQTIEEKVFSNERLNIIRDTFLFSCYTGYAPVDIAKLTWHEVTKNIDGQLWIYTTRQKTKVKADVPLLPQAIQIMEKYRNHPKCIEKGLLVPYNTNQTMNQYLKEVGDVCNIPFDLSYYCARHTFATTVTMLNGVSMESVSKMLGHKRITQTQTYAKIVNDKVGREMKQLSEKFNKLDSPKDNDASMQIAV